MIYNLNDDFLNKNKDYYRFEENYDWVKVTDHLIGLESFFHRRRESDFHKLIYRYGRPPFLDAGCGTGLFLRSLPQGSVGIDINPRNIEKAKFHALNARLIIGDLESLPFENGEFQTVVCSEVIEHFPKPKKMLGEIYRVLKVGGTLIGSVPAQTLIWKLRFLSSTRPREPFHRYFDYGDVLSILRPYRILLVKRSAFFMSWFFAAEKINRDYDGL